MIPPITLHRVTFHNLAPLMHKAVKTSNLTCVCAAACAAAYGMQVRVDPIIDVPRDARVLQAACHSALNRVSAHQSSVSIIRLDSFRQSAYPL
jgi:hypothetical protein